MKKQVVFLLAQQFFKKTFATKGLFGLLFIYLSVLVYVVISSWNAFEKNNQAIEHQYLKKVGMKTQISIHIEWLILDLLFFDYNTP